MHTVMERQEYSDANIYSKLSISTTPSYHVINMKNVSFWGKKKNTTTSECSWKMESVV